MTKAIYKNIKDLSDLLDQCMNDIEEDEDGSIFNYDDEWIADLENFNCDDEDLETEITEPVCECGSEKCGSPIHSHWCPLFKK